MSVFVISLAIGTADPAALKQPAQHFENTSYNQRPKGQLNLLLGYTGFSSSHHNVSGTTDKGFHYVEEIILDAVVSS